MSTLSRTHELPSTCNTKKMDVSGDNCSSGNLSAKALDATFNDIESRNDSEQDFDKEFDIQYNINTAIYLLP
jgi:hypothetical protein